MMKTALKSDFKSKTFNSSKNYICVKKKDICYFNFKFYQKLFVLFISFSTLLIFSESPRELENICECYYTRTICNVW